MSRIAQCACVASLLATGCISTDVFRTDTGFAQVPTSPFAPSAVQTVRRANPNFTPANPDIGLRVDAIGRKLLAANSQANLKPLFATIAAPEPEIFHADLAMVYVTESLVRQCKTEAELAAVLANELARMVSEREAVASRDARKQEPLPPIALPIGGPGNPYAADPTYFEEMARQERDHPRSARKAIVPPPDPHRIAGNLLEQAGYHRTDLDAVAPLLLVAEKNFMLERQFKGIVDAGMSWRPQ